MSQRRLALLLLMAAVFRGQDVPKFKADSTLVLIPVSVTDHSNRFVLGLHKQDFRILEDGVEQTVVNLSGEDTPLSIGLLYDRSGSMGDKLQTSRQAVTQFLKTMNPPDEAFLVDFADEAKVARASPAVLRNSILSWDSCSPAGSPPCSMQCTWGLAR